MWRSPRSDLTTATSASVRATPHHCDTPDSTTDATSSLADFCNTRIDIQGWGYEDAQPGCTSGGSDCWVRNNGGDYIKVNSTDESVSQSTRGWNLVVIDKCGCTITHRTEIDHFDNNQQVGCTTNSAAFIPFVNSIPHGSYIIGQHDLETQTFVTIMTSLKLHR